MRTLFTKNQKFQSNSANLVKGQPYSCGRRDGRNETTRIKSVRGSLRKISQWYPARRSNIILPRKDSDESTGSELFNDVCISGARQV